MGHHFPRVKPFIRPSKHATLEAEHRVADDIAPAYASAVLAAMRKARAIPLALAQEAFRQRNLHAFERAINWRPIQAVMQHRFRRASETALVAAARAHARLLPKKLWKQDETDDDRQAAEEAALREIEVAIGTAFDLRNPYAIRWADQHAAELVSEVTSETQAAIRAVVLRMWNEGLTVDQAAREIRRIVGLTERQAVAVENYRTGFDPDTDPSIVEARVEDYAQRALRQRADLIARTEGIRASVAGQQVLWDEATNAGLLEPARTFQQWLVTPDEKLCPICEALGLADPVPLGAPFPTGDYGPPAHPACRCALRLVFQGPATT